MPLADMPAPPSNLPAPGVHANQSAAGQWAETALTVFFAAAAVLFISFIAVVTGLV
jgi:hypothetical protein